MSVILDSLRALEATGEPDGPIVAVERLRPARRGATDRVYYGSTGLAVLAVAVAGWLVMRGDGEPAVAPAADRVPASAVAAVERAPDVPALAVQWPSPRAASARPVARVAPEEPARSRTPAPGGSAAVAVEAESSRAPVPAQASPAPAPRDAGEVPRAAGGASQPGTADEAAAGSVRAAASPAPSRRAIEALRTRLVFALEDGRHDDARAALETLTAALGTDSRFVREMHAWYLYRTGDIDAAAAAYDELLVADPDDAETRLTTVRIAMQRGRYEEAMRRLAVLLGDPRYRSEALEIEAMLAQLLAR